MNENNPKLGKGAKIWLILCIVVNTILFALILILADFSDMVLINYIALITSIFGIAGYIVLLTGRRSGLVMVAVCAVLSITLSIFQSQITVHGILSVVMNLFITTGVVSRSWNKMLPLGKSALTITTMFVSLALCVLTVFSGILFITAIDIKHDYDGHVELRNTFNEVILETHDFENAEVQSDNIFHYMIINFTSEGNQKLKQAFINDAESIHAKHQPQWKQVYFIYIGDERFSYSFGFEQDTEDYYIIDIISSKKREAQAVVKNFNENLERHRYQ